MSADADLGADVTELFNLLTGYSRQNRVSKAAGRAHQPAYRHQAAHRGPGRRRRPHPHQGQQPRRPGDHRRALRRVAGGSADRPHRAQHVLAPAGRSGIVRTHPGPVDRRPFPRALAALRVRRRSARVLPRVVGLDAAKPRPPGRGGGAGHRRQAVRAARRRSSRYCSPTTSSPGALVRTALGRRCPMSTGSTRTNASRSWRSRAPAATGSPTVSSTGSSPPSRMLEREVKLGAGPAFHLPDLSGVVDGATVTPPEAVRLETVYYDTADLRLARWGVSLRHRARRGLDAEAAASPHVDRRPVGAAARA